MSSLAPLEWLRFFEAAARRQSFVKAAKELHVSSSAVAHRIKVLEAHLDGALFERGHRGVRLNGRGKAYLKDVQRILAEKWLMPRLADFQLSHPGVYWRKKTPFVDPMRFESHTQYTCVP